MYRPPKAFQWNHKVTKWVSNCLLYLQNCREINVKVWRKFLFSLHRLSCSCGQGWAMMIGLILLHTHLMCLTMLLNWWDFFVETLHQMFAPLYQKSKSSSSVRERKELSWTFKGSDCRLTVFFSPFDRRRCQTEGSLFEVPVKVRTADELEQRPCSRLLAKTYLLTINPSHLWTWATHDGKCFGLWHWLPAWSQQTEEKMWGKKYYNITDKDS